MVKMSDPCDKINLPTKKEDKMSDQELADKIIDLFDAVIDESALDRLSEEELKAIDKMLTEAGY
jgi:hypothetical protein